MALSRTFNNLAVCFWKIFHLVGLLLLLGRVQRLTLGQDDERGHSHGREEHPEQQSVNHQGNLGNQRMLFLHFNKVI